MTLKKFIFGHVLTKIAEKKMKMKAQGMRTSLDVENVKEKLKSNPMNLTRKRIYTTLIILLLLGCIFYLHESIKAEVDYMFYSYDIINSEFRLNRIQNRKLNKIQEQFVEASVTKYGWTGYRMANMEYPYVGAVAVSDRSIPLGAKVVLDGVKYTVKDFTALWVWEKHGLVIDIYSEDSKNEMLVFGRQDKIVRLIY